MNGRVNHYCRSRDGCVRTTRVSVMNNGIARLPASAHFPAMIVAAVVRRPSGCRPSRRVHRVVVSRRRQEGSGIDDGSRFGKLFLVSNLSHGWTEGSFLLLQVSVAATGLI